MPDLVRRQEPKYKQMAFETAVRNPERYLGILSVVVSYEGKILNDECLLDLVSELYLVGEVSSEEIKIVSNTKVEDIKDVVIRVNSTRRADGGFPSGYCSRFWTYMRTLSELGFVYARYNDVLKISEIAHKLISAEIDEQEAFSIQALKFNRRSPYRNVSNDYNFFRLTLDILFYLKQNNRKLSYEQFIILMFNRSGTISETIEILDKNPFPNDKKVFEFVSRFYDNTNREGTVLKDYPDVVRRLMVISGFITIRYSGKKFVEINENKVDYIKDLMSVEFTITEEEKRDPEKYFNKLDSQNNIYLALVKKFRSTDTIDGVKYTSKLQEIITQYELSEDKIVKSIKRIESGSDIIPEFNEIPPPLKLEFYISILVALRYKDKFYVKPNYKADHIGKPYSHAPGNHGDINVYSESIYWLIEVTLIRNKTQQLNSETTSVIRHLASEETFSHYSEKYLSLVAPVIHADTRQFMDFALVQNQVANKKINVKPYNLEDFILVTQEGKNLSDMQEYTDKVFKEFLSALSKKSS